MVACGALRVTWLSGLMESGRPIKFSSTLFITGGEEAEAFVWGGEEAEAFVWGGGEESRGRICRCQQSVKGEP